MSNKAEFDEIFLELTGINADDAQVKDGFLFIPPSTDFHKKSREKRGRLTELAGPNGWKNHLVEGDYARWLIRRPTA